MTQTKLEKYSVAVQSRMKRCIAGSGTKRTTLVGGETLRSKIFTSVNVQPQRANGDANHRFAMIEEFDRFDVERKMAFALVKEEVNRMFVQFQRQCFEEIDVEAGNFFVVEIEFVRDDRIDVIIGQ